MLAMGMMVSTESAPKPAVAGDRDTVDIGLKALDSSSSVPRTGTDMVKC
jgi:hypothetical protein